MIIVNICLFFTNSGVQKVPKRRKREQKVIRGVDKKDKKDRKTDRELKTKRQNLREQIEGNLKTKD